MEKRVLKIIKYIEKNGLAKAVTDFKLIFRDYGHKVLLKYDTIESPMNYDEVRECRGLVIEKNSFKILSMSFERFFNAEETYAAKIDWTSAKVLEKIDGSMIQVYFDYILNEWCSGTTGTADGSGEVNNKNGTTFADLFWGTIKSITGNVEEFVAKLIEGNTYVFELTSPENIVVTPHTTYNVTLLTIRNNLTLVEFNYEDVVIISNLLNIPIVKQFNLNINDVGQLKKTFEGMPFSEEGYVVVDANFNRIKVKNPSYLAAHRLKGKSALHHIMSIVKDNEIEEFGATFPERKEELFRLKENYDKLLITLETTWEELKLRLPKNITPAEKKKYAEAVFEVTKKNGVPSFTGLYFGLKDGKVDTVKEYLYEYDNKRLYSIL